ncbi:hypothetical protein D3C76_1792810 [compost metagenome]
MARSQTLRKCCCVTPAPCMSSTAPSVSKSESASVRNQATAAEFDKVKASVCAKSSSNTR